MDRGATPGGGDLTLEWSPGPHDILIALVRPEDKKQLAPILEEAGFTPSRIQVSDHPRPGTIEIVAIPPPTLRDLSFPG